MEKRRCILLDPNHIYVERFMEYVQRRKNFCFDIMGFTREAELLHFLEEEEADLALVDEGIWNRISEEGQARMREQIHCLILLTDRLRGGEKLPSVYRYQTMGRLLREALEHYEASIPKKVTSRIVTQLDIFYSPKGECGKSTCAMLLGHRLAEKGGRSVLYMNLEAFAQERGEHSLSDLLYYRAQGGKGMTLQSLTESKGGLQILAPVVNPEDRWKLSSEDLVELLKEIRDQGIYDTVILDVGNEGDPIPVLNLGNRVFLVDDGTASCGKKMDDLLHYVEKQRLGVIPEHWHRVKPPRLPILEGARPGCRQEELESWLEKQWKNWEAKP